MTTTATAPSRANPRAISRLTLAQYIADHGFAPMPNLDGSVSFLVPVRTKNGGLGYQLHTVHSFAEARPILGY